jgi:hypothetical protein
LGRVGSAARMNKSCCFVLQYNTEPLVLVLQYYLGKWAILKQYQKKLYEQSTCTAYAGISDRVTEEIEIRRISNQSLSPKYTKVTKLFRRNYSRKLIT